MRRQYESRQRHIFGAIIAVSGRRLRVVTARIPELRREIGDFPPLRRMGALAFRDFAVGEEYSPHCGCRLPCNREPGIKQGNVGLVFLERCRDEHGAICNHQEVHRRRATGLWGAACMPVMTA